MIIIEEKPSNHLPNLTSLFFKLGTYNPSIFKSLIQQPLTYYDKKLKEYEFPLNKLFYLVDLLIKVDDVSFIPYVATKKQNIVISNDYKVKLFKHQIEGIEYGVNHNGWLLLDDQGLGKTCQMICLADTLRKIEGIEHCLIICGVNGLKYNWADEIKKFSDLDYIILGQTLTRTGKPKMLSVTERLEILKNPIKEFFVITNLETLQSEDFAKVFKKSKNKFGMIVFDEAHKAKSPTSKSGSTLLELNSPHNIALTGTLIMNNPENAYVALKWTNNTDCTFGMFKSMYNVYGGFGGKQVIGHKNLDLLREHLMSCSLRRLKQDVLDLPDKTYQIEYVELGKDQRELYDEVAKGIAEELNLLPKNQKLTIRQEMVMNMRLRQVTAYPGMLTTENISSAKLDRLEELVEQIVSQGDKVVIFNTFKGTVPEIVRRLEKYEPLVCTGNQSEEEINERKVQFQSDDNRKVLVATWQKMGTGVTLTKASYIIFVDTPWTDAEFQQCADRIYRIGQSKNVCIITLVAKDTYDERVLEILERKEILSDYILDGDITDFTQYDDMDIP